VAEVIRLRDHEKLVVLRHRLGLSQRQMAYEEDVPLRQLQRMESGERPLTPGLKAVRVTDLSPGERCFIMRLRAGKTQAHVARELRCCRRWVMLMETGRAPADDLLWYWEQ
jgi:hypothetical protein